MIGVQNSPVIVVAAYDRIHSLQRLLHSLEQAIYPKDAVKLIISIDKGGRDEVIKYAEQWNWTHGEKKVIRQEQHLGLKEHILRCGDLTAEYGSIILFEDDLFVSPYFYDYIYRCLNYYGSDVRIAGVSLYSYDVSENGFNPFVPVDDGSDVYFMQVASSWGQAWTHNQWNSFREWFEKHPELTKEELPPAYLFTWQENSWKRHFVRYLHFNDKFFVFPKHSFTTNFEEPGGTAHTKGLYQVPIAKVNREYILSTLDDSKSIYDACFEMTSACLKKWCPFLKAFDFTVDLYGTLAVRNCKTNYLLTVKEAKEEVLGFSLEMFPPVLNIINNIQGNQIKLVKRENVLSEKVASDTGYYKFTPVSEIIFQDELVERVEKVYANYSEKIDALHKSYTEKVEGLNIEIRKLHEQYHQQISRLHEDYAEKMKIKVEEALKNYQFNLDNPQFAIVTLVNRENFESALHSAKSVINQDYPRISHRIILIGNADGIDLSSFESESKCKFQTVNSITEALDAASLHYNHAESDYHCWLEAGTVLMPKALFTVKEVFKRFAEVNWLKGLPIKAGDKDEFTPMVNGIDFRWDSNKFYNSSLEEISQKLSESGIFWKKHLWHNTGGTFNHNFHHISDIEYFNRLFSSDMLYVIMANLAASKYDYKPSAQAEKEFNTLKNNFPKSGFTKKFIRSIFYPFFKKDIPLLRAIHKSQHSYPPLIRFDYNSQSFYLSEY